MHLQICAKCGHKFKTRKTEDDTKCYRCHLFECTGGNAPEEADLNTAALLSGIWTEAEEAGFWSDMRALEEGRRPREDYFDDSLISQDGNSPYYADRDFMRLCEKCGEHDSACYCDYPEDDE